LLITALPLLLAKSLLTKFSRMKDKYKNLKSNLASVNSAAIETGTALVTPGTTEATTEGGLLCRSESKVDKPTLKQAEFDFNSEDARMLCLVAGDVVSISGEKSGWLLAQRVSDGKSGLVPPAFLTAVVVSDE
jgi:hypothetical protein